MEIRAVSGAAELYLIGPPSVKCRRAPRGFQKLSKVLNLLKPSTSFDCCPPPDPSRSKSPNSNLVARSQQELHENDDKSSLSPRLESSLKPSHHNQFTPFLLTLNDTYGSDTQHLDLTFPTESLHLCLKSSTLPNLVQHRRNN